MNIKIIKRVLFAILFVVGVLFSSQSLADYRIIYRGDSDKLIIFVHGLWGDPEITFSAGEGYKSWPEMMDEDNEGMRDQLPLSKYSIAVLGYPSSQADRLSTPQIASRLLTDLLDNDVLSKYKSIYFITYSLGGLVVKEILMAASNNHDYLSLAVNTKSVFFIAAPSEGSPIANYVEFLPKVIVGRLAVDLTTIDDNT